MEQILYPIPGSYSTNSPVDVSIIIPLYNSRDVVKDQIVKWLPEKKLKTEIIYVDDQCPERSKASVYSTWNNRSDKQEHQVRLICSLANRGFGGANNLGAYFAQGEILIFLNSDTTVTDNWIQPMVDVLKDKTVGLVGNLQLKDGGEWHGTIDSAGSEWCWEQMNFMHIGRHIYKNKLLKEPMSIKECPNDLLEVGEREMVTGCCFAIRKKLYDKIGGFNHNYRVGYWEDSEICMTLKSMGYRIMYQPNSVIYHKLHHSKSGGHNFHEFNKQYFFNKWVDSGEIDQCVKAKRIVNITKVSNILVRRCAARGDVLMATSILPGIKLKYPNSKIYFCTDCPEVLKNNPYIDGIIPKSKLHTANFQLVYNLDYAYERMPLVNICKAFSLETNIQSSEPYLDCEPIQGLPEKYVAIHAGKTAWVGRNWNTELFLKIADKLDEIGYDVVWVGGENEGGEDVRKFDFRGKTSIQQLGTIMKNAKFFIGIDSFPFHVAQTMKTPGVCFFGSILPETRIINDNMKSITAERLKCLGCHHRKFAPATVTDKCETGDLDCEKLVTLCMFWEKIKEHLCNQNV